MVGANIDYRVKWIVLIVTALVCAFLSGCATFTYGGVTYSSPEEATRAAKSEVRSNIAGVMPADKKINGTLKVVVPTREVMRQKGISNPKGTNEVGLDFITNVMEMGFLGIYETVERGAIFERTTVVRSADPENELIGEADYKLWLVGISPEQWQWYLSTKSGDRKVPIASDMALKGSARMNSFNNSVIDAAQKLGASLSSRNRPKGVDDADSVEKFGTGFFVNDGGFAITNAHVVEGCTKVFTAKINGESFSATFIAADRQNDLALLKVSERPPSHGTFRAGPAVRQGEQVVIYGYPLAGLLASTGNLSIGIVTALSGLADDTSQMQISAPVQPGNSGGPVVDESGLIIGVVRSKLDVIRAAAVTGDIAQNVNFAIKQTGVTSFLNANGISYEAVTGQQKRSTADLAGKVKSYTFLISCGNR